MPAVKLNAQKWPLMPEIMFTIEIQGMPKGSPVWHCSSSLKTRVFSRWVGRKKIKPGFKS
jgi:hypothetical protein